MPFKVLVWADLVTNEDQLHAPDTLAARYGLSKELAGRLVGINAVTDAVIAI